MPPPAIWNLIVDGQGHPAVCGYVVEVDIIKAYVFHGLVDVVVPTAVD